MLEPTAGPNVRVVSTFPADRDGFGCGLTDLACGVPTDTSIELRFDRFLLPSTATRQSISLYTGDPANAGLLPELTPRYDVIERVVSYRLPSGVTLRPNTLYTVELPVPVYDDDFGFRAFDGAPLDEDTTVRFGFQTSNQLDPDLPPEVPAGTCFDGADGPGFAKCAVCHGSNGFMGLNLTSPDGLLRTAINRVAHETETGPTTGTPLQDPARFGAQMPIVDPGRPENSYLMYKLVRAPENYRLNGAADPDLCGSRHRAAVDPDACVPASPSEIERLRAWFLRGEAMPRRPEGAAARDWLTRPQLERVESWILAGAPCP